MRRKQGRSGLGRPNLEVDDGLGRRQEDTKRASSMFLRLKSNVRVGLAALKTTVGVGLVAPLQIQNQNPPKATEERI